MVAHHLHYLLYLHSICQYFYLHVAFFQTGKRTRGFFIVLLRVRKERKYSSFDKLFSFDELI